MIPSYTFEPPWVSREQGNPRPAEGELLAWPLGTGLTEKQRVRGRMMNAAWESLHHAALEFASADSIKQRLTKAFSSHLAELDPDSLPAHLRPSFQRLSARLTAVAPLRGETAVSATVRKMSNEEASCCAQEIVGLMKGFLDEGARATPARNRNVLSFYAAEG